MEKTKFLKQFLNEQVYIYLSIFQKKDSDGDICLDDSELLKMIHEIWNELIFTDAGDKGSLLRIEVEDTWILALNTTGITHDEWMGNKNVCREVLKKYVCKGNKPLHIYETDTITTPTQTDHEEDQLSCQDGTTHRIQ